MIRLGTMAIFEHGRRHLPLPFPHIASLVNTTVINPLVCCRD